MTRQQTIGVIVLISFGILIFWLIDATDFASTLKRPLRDATLSELFTMYMFAVLWWRWVMGKGEAS